MSTVAGAPTQAIVGIDVGTTGVKAVAFGVDTPWQRMVLREYPLLQPRPGWQVQDPAMVAAETERALADCVTATGDAEVLAVAVGTAMHGLLGLDAALEPLTPLITWADARAHDEAAQLRAAGLAGDLHRRTGTPVHPMTPLTKLMWFARHEPELCARVRWWVGLKELVLARLTGTIVTELSSASGTGMLDMAARAWSPEALELAGVPAAHLPEIRPTTAILPLSAECARRIGLPAGTPVVVGAADGPLGNLGTSAMSPGVAGLSLGTSGAIRMGVDTPTVDEHGSLFCYALTDTAWVVGGAVSNGASVVRWARRALTPDLHGDAGAGGADEALLELAAAAPAGSDGLVMLPYLLAERAPLWDPDLPGAVLGLRDLHTRAHLVRAAVEGVCMQLRVVLEQLDGLAPVHTVRATGGAFRSPLWRDVMAASLDRPLRAVGAAAGTALGAAGIGLFAIGRASGLTDAVAQLSPAGEAEPAVEPDRELVAIYDRLRHATPGLIDGLGAFADLLRGQAGRGPPGPR